MFDIRSMIDAHLASVADAVREAVAGADTNLATAVHEVRKALRRARAIVDLVGGELPRKERRAIRSALREVRRELGTARDHTVAPRVLAALELEAGDRDAVRAVVEASAAHAPDEPATRRALTAAATCATEQVMALHTALPPELDRSVLVDGVRSLYRDVRRARRAANESRRAFHEWRRRTKELTYQLDLLASLPGVADIGREIDKVNDVQGPVVDLIMVRDFVRHHRDQLDEETAARLLGVIDDRLSPLMKEARRAAKPAFKPRANDFARRLVEADGAAR
ncbi:MAG: CHAD domain-containing protein [Deltaproteobacteria bacterium]|nr:CHAD domain-containing protein [Deltaproteobacteria bacterium]